MKKKLLGIPLYWFLIVFAVAIIGILFGSFFDKSLSDAVANSHNGFGMFVETYGESLAYGVAIIGAVLAWLGLWKRKAIWQKILGWAILVAGTIVMVYMLGDSFYGNPNSNEVLYGFRISNAFLAFFVAFLILAFIGVITFLLADKSESKYNDLLRIGLIMIAAMLLQWGLMHFLKQIGGRPRWRFLYEIGGIWEGQPYDYQNWWEFAWFKNPKLDYFKSWPSGHTATAALVMLIGLFPRVLKKNFKHSELILGCCGFAYAIIVAIARILAGAHFLADVSFGMLVGSLSAFLCVFVGSKIFPSKESPEVTEEPAKEEPAQE